MPISVSLDKALAPVELFTGIIKRPAHPKSFV